MNWTNESAAQAFSEIADLLEIKGENPFKIKAYLKASRVLRELEDDLEVVRAEGRLRSIPGVGKAIADKLEAFLQTGSIPQLEELREEIPAGLVDIAGLPGLGAKKTAQLHKELSVQDLAGLHSALLEGKVEQLKGFSKKSQAKILAAVEKALNTEPRFIKSRLEKWGKQVLESLAGLPGTAGAKLVGSVRRKCPSGERVEILLHCHDLGIAEKELQQRLGQGGGEFQQVGGCFLLQHPGGAVVSISLGEHRSAGWNCLRLTGPESFVESVRRKSGGRNPEQLEAESEEALFTALELTPVLPELRHREDCWAVSEDQLLTEQQLRGNLHAHTTYSDGQNTIVEMVQKAISSGHEYFGVSDHSRSLVVAGGLTEEKLGEQLSEILALREQHPDFRIWASSEVDILEDGSLDYPDQVLEKLDYVVAAVHSFFHLTPEAMTRRLLKGLSHPKVRILAHPTGRLLTRRDGYQADWDSVFQKCAELRVAVEINSSPWRLDLSEELLDRAVAAGCLVAINTDAHSLDEFDSVRHGVDMARRSAVPPKRIVNTWGEQQLREWFQAR